MLSLSHNEMGECRHLWDLGALKFGKTCMKQPDIQGIVKSASPLGGGNLKQLSLTNSYIFYFILFLSSHK